MKKAFTLIELVVSIGILSIVMIFLYKSYASLNKSNSFYKKEVFKLKNEQLKKKTLFLDFSLAMNVDIKSQDKNKDIVFLQSSNSMHNRYNPYIAYIFKEQRLYRLESLTQFNEYPLSVDTEFSVEYFGEVDSFRVYKSDDNTTKSYLIHIDFKEEEDVLLKVNLLQ